MNNNQSFNNNNPYINSYYGHPQPQQGYQNQNWYGNWGGYVDNYDDQYYEQQWYNNNYPQ
jgi:hypothetical protein